MFAGIHKRADRGFTLIELAIVLSIAGLLFVGLWRLLSGGNTTLRDNAAATQQEQLIAAVKAYLADGTSKGGANNNGQQFLKNMTTTTANLPLPNGAGVCPNVDNLFCNYLPSGFNSTTVNSYGQIYSIEVLNPTAVTSPGIAPTSYSFMVVTTGGDVIPDTSGGRISSLIGGDGGFIYSTNVCGSNPTIFNFACGAFGAWSQDIAAYGYGSVAGAAPVPTTGGYIATRTIVTPALSNFNPWLERIDYISPNTNNYLDTMTLDLYMGQTSGGVNTNINMANTLLVPTQTTGGNINMAGITAGNTGGTINMGVPGATSGGGTINLNGGTLTNNPTATADGSTISLTGNMNFATAGFPPAATMTVSSNCIETNPDTQAGSPGPFCQDALQVNGDTYITGLLSANALYSGTFIYDSSARRSDMRLKDNIQPLHKSLDEIMQLKPVSYTLKSTGKQNLGVLAQDIQKVYPQLVVPAGNGYLAVDYEGLISPLVKAVQELQEENEALKVRLEKQELYEKKLEIQFSHRTSQ